MCIEMKPFPFLLLMMLLLRINTKLSPIWKLPGDFPFWMFTPVWIWQLFHRWYSKITSWNSKKKMPHIDLENYIKCMKCVHDCPSDAIDIEQGTINDTCIHCGHCVAICPESTVFPDEGDINKLKAPSVSPNDFKELSAGIRTCRSYKADATRRGPATRSGWSRPENTRRWYRCGRQRR